MKKEQLEIPHTTSKKSKGSSNVKGGGSVESLIQTFPKCILEKHTWGLDFPGYDDMKGSKRKRKNLANLEQGGKVWSQFEAKKKGHTQNVGRQITLKAGFFKNWVRGGPACP